MTGKLLVVVEGGQIIDAKLIAPEACVIDPASRIDVETLIREFVPEEILPALHRTIVARLGECPVITAAGDPEAPKGIPGGGGEGGVAPATLPLLESGTPRTLAGVPEIGGKRCPGPISNRAGPVMAP